MPALAHLADPLPLLAVTAGAFGIAALQTGFGAVFPAFSALFRLFRARPEAERDYARAAVNAVDRIAELEGLPRTDKLKGGPAFLREAVRRLADAREIDGFALWAEQAIGDRADRHARVIALWDGIADAAPAMGMAGTIIGLIGMFMGMDDPATIGPAMAFALLTTLYGMVVANMVAGPVARRLERLSATEIAWQRALIERLVAVGRREEGQIAAALALHPAKPRRPGVQAAA